MDNYNFNANWSEEDNVYIATCSEFPGVSAFGETPENALSEMRTALEMAIETYQEEGWPLPKPKSMQSHRAQFCVRLPKSLHSKLAAQAEAEAEGVSLNSLVVAYLSESVGTHKGSNRQVEKSA